MKITMLGTGNAMVTECYNTCFALEDQGQYFLVDGGGGNTLLRQLKAADIPWMKLRQIFVTHKHIDHLLGIVWMMRMITQCMAGGIYDGEATIYAHDEVIAILREMAEQVLQPKQTQFIGDRLHMEVVQNGESREIIGHPVTFFDIHSTKAKQYGFCMDMGNGEKLTCCGDEPCSEFERPYVENSKWVLHEAFCTDAQADIFNPYEKHHSTVKDACTLAESLHVQNLLLYHTEDRNLAHRKALYSEEGRQYYSGNLFIPDDLEVIRL